MWIHGQHVCACSILADTVLSLHSLPPDTRRVRKCGFRTPGTSLTETVQTPDKRSFVDEQQHILFVAACAYPGLSLQMQTGFLLQRLFSGLAR